MGFVLALGACANTGFVVVTNVTQISGFSMGHVQYAAALGEVFVEIRGNAFDSQSDDYEEAIASTLRLPASYPRARITTRPSGDARVTQRLAFVFNPNRTPGAALMCDGIDRIPLAPSGAETHVQAAFCSGSRRLAEAHAVGPAGTGPEDPAFKNLMRQVMLNLLRNPVGGQVSFRGAALEDCRTASSTSLMRRCGLL